MADPGTTSRALFRQSAEDLATKLAEHQQAEALQMAREARELIAVFAAWNAVRPSNEVRIASIHQLFDLNRRAMDFLSKQARTKGYGAHPPSSRRIPSR